MKLGEFLEFIYFISLAILVNFSDKLVTVSFNLVLTNLAPSRNESMLIIIFYIT